MRRALFKNDIANAHALCDSFGLSKADAINLFRMNKTQANDFVNNTQSYYRHSYNCTDAQRPIHKLRGAVPTISARTVEACAGLWYRGYTQKEMAEALGVNPKTLSARLVKYHGYTRSK